MYLCADIDELTRDTGFVPQVDFKTGIRQTIEYVKHMEMGRL
jgi:nucleoside-diphosphate-sugar epimerase